MREPIIHSHIIDSLPEMDERAYDEVFCKDCNAMVHAPNNECMITWVETGVGEWCLSCFALLEWSDLLDEKHALPDLPQESDDDVERGLNED